MENERNQFFYRLKNRMMNELSTLFSESFQGMYSTLFEPRLEFLNRGSNSLNLAQAI